MPFPGGFPRRLPWPFPGRPPNWRPTRLGDLLVPPNIQTKRCRNVPIRRTHRSGVSKFRVLLQRSIWAVLQSHRSDVPDLSDGRLRRLAADQKGCLRIPFGKGVCGTSAASRETFVVDDVHAFPGHIACSHATRSEIVVPLVVNGSTALVLDVDSEELNDFDDIDKQGLEAIVSLIDVN